MVSRAKRFPNDRLDQAAVKAWCDSLPKATDEKARKGLLHAVELCFELLAELQDRTGEQLSLYAMQVADLLVQLEMDDETVSAALLYRIVGNDLKTQEEIEAIFGAMVAGLVKDLLLIQQLSPGVLTGREEKGEEHSENLRRMLLGISSDVRAVLILLAERVHLMRRLSHLDENYQSQFSRNTRDIFAPLANRLGVWQLKWELEDLSLRYLEPEQYRSIAKQLEERRDERIAYIKHAVAMLEDAFSENDIRADISGRPKHLYSIWKKMYRKQSGFEHIFDVRAVRVLVDSVADCYVALGIVHSIWKHIPREFDDYIATPKANLYQSIHTVVVGPDEKPLEIQIRTHEMHSHAEHGVAAHWRYKEQKGSSDDLERRISWMRQWLEQREPESEQESSLLASDVHQDYEQTQVYVLTPQGKVIELPNGSTPVDFAYAIHSSVGHRCRGARIDGHIVPLNTPLESGQTVDILTHKEERPSRDWMSPHLGYIKTSRARNRVKSWYRHQDFDSHVEMGKASLERELTRLGFERPELAKIAPEFNLKGVDDLYAAIGRGDVSPVQIAGWRHREEREKKPKKTVKKRQQRGKSTHGASADITVDGIDDLMTHLGKCCKPVPSDSIIGYITRGRGVTVHRSDCSVVRHMKEDDRARLVDVRWGDEGEDAAFEVDVRVVALDRKGLMRDVTSLFSNEEIDVTGINSHSDRRHQKAIMRFSLQIDNVGQLSRIIDKLAQLPDVVEVSRIT
ncbi:GTP diphosphokinase [Solemya velum gill symbiont]|uniref:RelA/SpoT family protein n=1 Tax=Solemya velum gill symbiont TaxID=2340 RepID=UPI0009981588|nr:bifunctional (p)ppGpp synthetase/guanosine-3',5'-bis(diphosphate) 3'-pyrophosphohydrolase [Solemya velum gill symbiont]OOY51830.1 GTP diphosphokinase [Solemya velum gill symbiont]